MSKDKWQRLGGRWLCVVCFLFSVIVAGGGSAHGDALLQGATIGITEHLGEKIPLDTTFRDEVGKTVCLADLVTGPTIILPVYFNCTNVCYNLQWGLAKMVAKINRKPGVDYHIISLSFDEQDTPPLAAKFKRVYLSAMGMDFPADGWRFLTGDLASIRRITDGAGFGFERKGRDFLHPSGCFLIARDGTIVRYLYGTTFLAKDLTLALIEARDGTSGATIRKIVDYCFVFDAQQKTYAFNLLRLSATVVIICTGGFLAYLIRSGKRRTRTKN